MRHNRTDNTKKNITSIDLPEGIISIGKDAFSTQTFKTFTIPSSVKELGNRVFFGCKELEVVYCKAITPPALGIYAFHNYTSVGLGSYFILKSLQAIYVPSESVDEYKMADGWKELADIIVGYDF